MIEFIQDQLKNNEIAQAAVLAAPMSILVYSAKNLPGKIYETAKKWLSVDVRFNSDMPEFQSVLDFVTSNIIVERFSRTYTFEASEKWDVEVQDERVSAKGLALGYGVHFGWYKGCLVVVDRSLDDSAQTKEFKEHLTVTFVGRSKEAMKSFEKEVIGLLSDAGSEFSSVGVYVNNSSHWTSLGTRPLRPISSVFASCADEVLASIRQFESKQQYNRERGLPNHLGVLLHGQPGCGKSSLIHALASELKRDILYLNLGSVENDKEFVSLIASKRNPQRTLLVVEDIDAAGVDVSDRDSTDTPLTLSTMLNTFDGLMCPDGLVVVATTNRLEALDPALIRSGRFDVVEELKPLDLEDFYRMRELLDKPNKPVPQLPMSGSDMRAYILESGGLLVSELVSSR